MGMRTQASASSESAAGIAPYSIQSPHTARADQSQQVDGSAEPERPTPRWSCRRRSLPQSTSQCQNPSLPLGLGCHPGLSNHSLWNPWPMILPSIRFPLREPAACTYVAQLHGVCRFLLPCIASRHLFQMVLLKVTGSVIGLCQQHGEVLWGCCCLGCCMVGISPCFLPPCYESRRCSRN